MLKVQIEQDLKTAMLAKDKQRVEVLRGLKSAILYEEVAKKARDTGLDEAAVLAVLAREAKRRDESARLYADAGEQARADAELAEKQIIDGYLPAQMSDEELEKIVDETIAKLGDAAQMGQVIGAVKQAAGQSADGARIASIVKSRLQAK